MKSTLQQLFFLLLPVFVFIQKTEGQSSSETVSQPVEIAISAGYDFLISNFHAGNYTMTRKEDGRRDGITVSIAVSKPLNQFFYLGVDAGMLSGSYGIDNEFTSKTEGYSLSYQGIYEENRINAFVVPEVRFLKQHQIFLKAGVGLSKTFYSRFINGTQHISGNLDSNDLTGRSGSGSEFYGGFIGGGFNLALFKKINLKLEARRYLLPHGARSDDQIVFHFGHFTAQAGLGFEF